MPRHFFKQFGGLKKVQAAQAIAATMVLGLIYWLSTVIPPGPMTWALAIPADLIIALTALARVNDLDPAHTGFRWQIRKIGYMLAAVAAVGYIFLELEGRPQYPPWKSLMLQWGVALTWLTTPGLPPWHRYINGDFRKKEIKDGSQV